jgi:salicylate hydroxylase
VSEPLRALIAGAGVGGLSAAIALARAGVAVTVLERAPLFEEVGAGLQLSPNATSLLRQWGVLDGVRDVSTAPESLRIRRARDGADLMRLPLGPVAELRWGAPHLVIHRADLQRVLLEHVARHPLIRVETGIDVVGFAASSEQVEIGARRGEDSVRFDGDFLIGADGLRSTVRNKLGLGAADRPLWSGRTAWRTLVDASAAPAHAMRLETNLWLGAKAHLVHYPLRHGSLVNVVAITQDSWRGDDAQDFWSTPGRAEDVVTRFRSWHPDARSLVGAAKDWRRWPLFDRNTPPRWSSGRVSLLGDAAHPMMPFLAQGAVQAIEDAGELGAVFAMYPGNVPAALALYEKKRLPRTAAVQLASRRQGTIYHLSGPLGLARDMTLRAMGFERMMDRLDWIYQYGRSRSAPSAPLADIASAT